MKDEKEFPISINDKHTIKLYEEQSRSLSSPSGLELSIGKCPITCNNCKTVYSNKLTGIRIVCSCSCHSAVNQEVI
ncbi:MAG: hypothetical protein AB7U98_11100 [Candidatus Nitrosocosmicus sp.]